MGTRDDLLTMAQRFAAAAVADSDPQPTTTPGHLAPAFARSARDRVESAKVALEAAALASNVQPSDIDAALGNIRAVLEQAGVAEAVDEMDTTEFLQATYGMVLDWRQRLVASVAYENAYDELRELAESMESDFVAGGTEVSMRIAGRIRVVLDDGTAMINRATQGVGTDGDGN